LPSGQRYWTVLDEDLQVVAVADAFLRQQRFGRDGAESTTKAYAHAIALFLRWCARSGRSWQGGVEQLGLFMTWLAHAGPAASIAAGAAAKIHPRTLFQENDIPVLRCVAPGDRAMKRPACISACRDNGSP
jgi:hypothetical protein